MPELTKSQIKFFELIKKGNVRDIQAYVAKLSPAEKVAMTTAKFRDQGLRYQTNPIDYAICLDKNDVLRYLLTIPEFKANVTASENQALFLTIKPYRPEAFKILTELVEVRNNKRNIELLADAIRNDQMPVVNALLTLPEVRSRAADNDNAVLIAAVGKENSVMVRALLQIPAIVGTAAGRDNRALDIAAYNGSIDIVKILLEVPAIKDNIARNNNLILRNVIDSHNFRNKNETLNLLAVIPAVQQGLLTNHGAQLIEFTKERSPLQRTFIKQLCDSGFTIYGMSLAQLLKRVPEDKHKDAIREFLSNPIAYLDSNNYPPGASEAVRIFYTAQLVTDYQYVLAESERNRERFTNVDDETRIGAVKGHYNNVIKPHFREEFESHGRTDSERVEHIEQRMREMFLNAILKEAQAKVGDENASRVVNVINSLTADKKQKLLQGNDETLMNETRLIFSDTSSPAQTAWRAYDKWAQVGGGWPNLLTSPLVGQNNSVFTVGTVGLAAPTTKTASDLAREMMAYSFLLVTDKKDGDDDTRSTREAAFIAKIAEVRRAHNPGAAGTDDPSCLPGTVSRAGDTWIAHSKSVIPDAPKLLEEELRSYVIEKFQRIPKEEQEKFYFALIKLNRFNAADIMSGKEEFTKVDVKLRAQFVDMLGSDREMMQEVNRKLQARGSRALNRHEFNVYVPALLSDMGGPWMVQYLTSLYRKGREEELTNPYTEFLAMQQSTGVSKQQATMMLIRNLPGKAPLAMQMADLLAKGKFSEVMETLKTGGLAPDKLLNIENGINQLKEQQSQSIADAKRQETLWNELYQAYKDHPIPEKGDVLKEITEEVVQNKRNLTEVLKEHQLPVKEQKLKERRKQLIIPKLDLPPRSEDSLSIEPASTLGKSKPEKPGRT